MKQYKNNRENDLLCSLFIMVTVGAIVFGSLFVFGFVGFFWMLLVLLATYAYIVVLK